ncbi:MAG: SUMF1/EgtB/PvdO family nonheme iron enzyme [Parvularculaceae bacterium]
MAVMQGQLNLVALVAACLLCLALNDAKDTSSIARACAVTDLSPVWIEGGRSLMGDDSLYPEETPEREVTVDGFFLGTEPEVTVERMQAFTQATGYVTLAERPVDASLDPDIDLALLAPGGAVFSPLQSGNISNYVNWWSFVPGATYLYPEGPQGRRAAPKEPATQIAFEDAQAFAHLAEDACQLEADGNTAPAWRAAPLR